MEALIIAAVAGLVGAGVHRISLLPEYVTEVRFVRAEIGEVKLMISNLQEQIARDFYAPIHRPVPAILSRSRQLPAPQPPEEVPTPPQIGVTNEPRRALQ